MFDRFIGKCYNKYKNKKIKIIYDTKYNCNNEIIGFLKDSPTPMSMTNKYYVPSFTIRRLKKDTYCSISVLAITKIFLIVEDYQTKLNLYYLKNNNIVNDDIFKQIIQYIDTTEYKEIEI